MFLSVGKQFECQGTDGVRANSVVAVLVLAVVIVIVIVVVVVVAVVVVIIPAILIVVTLYVRIRWKGRYDIACCIYISRLISLFFLPLLFHLTFQGRSLGNALHVDGDHSTCTLGIATRTTDEACICPCTWSLQPRDMVWEE